MVWCIGATCVTVYWHVFVVPHTTSTNSKWLISSAAFVYEILWQLANRIARLDWVVAVVLLLTKRQGAQSAVNDATLSYRLIWFGFALLRLAFNVFDALTCCSINVDLNSSVLIYFYYFSSVNCWIRATQVIIIRRHRKNNERLKIISLSWLWFDIEPLLFVFLILILDDKLYMVSLSFSVVFFSLIKLRVWKSVHWQYLIAATI